MIEIKNTQFTYENSMNGEGVKQVNLSIKKGEIVLVCGPSGCGKTTLTRLINGLIPHYYKGVLEGEVRVADKVIKAHQLYDFASVMGSVFQNPRSQFFNVDTESELAFGCENLGLAPGVIAKRITRIAKELTVEDLLERSIFELSGGEKQKIACGSVAAMEPDLLVLDEPTSNLDTHAIEALKKILIFWKKQGKTIIIAEHRLYFLRHIVDRVIYMEKGEIRGDYDSKTFFEQSIVTKRLKGKLRTLDMALLNFENRKKAIGSKKMVLKDFCVKYGAKEVLRIDEIQVPRESVIAVIGHNGAGKTTFSRCLCGLEKRCKGIVKVDTHLLKNKDRLNSFFMVMQDVNHQLFTESVWDEVMLSMAKENEREANIILNSLDLMHLKERHPMSLSGGEKQRVAIGCAIASKRDTILFDEPTSGLDLEHMKGVAQNIKLLHMQNKNLFIVTHDLEFILACCTYVIHVEEGKVAAHYSIDEQGVKKLKNFFLQSTEEHTNRDNSKQATRRLEA